MKSFRVANFNHLASQYRNYLTYGVTNATRLERFIWFDDCKEIDPRGILKRLIPDPIYKAEKLQRQEWLEVLKKQDPVWYDKNGSKPQPDYSRLVTNDALYDLHCKNKAQIEFAKKVLILPQIVNQQYDEIHDSYLLFLNHCYLNRGVTLIPSLIEDFGWHVHMLDHHNYVKDTTAIFGKIFDHDTKTKITKSSRDKSDAVRSSTMKKTTEDDDLDLLTMNLLLQQNARNNISSSFSSCTSSDCSSSSCSSSSCGSSCSSSSCGGGD